MGCGARPDGQRGVWGVAQDPLRAWLPAQHGARDPASALGGAQPPLLLLVSSILGCERSLVCEHRAAPPPATKGASLSYYRLVPISLYGYVCLPCMRGAGSQSLSPKGHHGQPQAHGQPQTLVQRLATSTSIISSCPAQDDAPLPHGHSQHAAWRNSRSVGSGPTAADAAALHGNRTPQVRSAVTEVSEYTDQDSDRQYLALHAALCARLHDF